MDFAPQNTVPSFLMAQEQGADGIELDVQLTKDGVLVVFHDAKVDALTDGRGPIGELPWSVVSKLDAGSHFGREWAGTTIPTLEDVLTALDNRLTINVEMKTSLSEEAWWDRWLAALRGPRKLATSRADAARAECAPLADALAKVLAPLACDRFIISSFDPFALEAIRPHLPTVALGFLHSPTVPWNTPELVQSLPFQAWHPHHSQVTPESVAQEKAAGHRVHTWTVNDPRHAARLSEWGVDALITNRPAEILEALG